MEISTAKIWKYGNEARQDAIFPFPFLEIWKSAFWKLENGKQHSSQKKARKARQIKLCVI